MLVRLSAPLALIALLFFTGVAPVQAAPRALTRTTGLLAFAPAGEQVLVARAQGRNLRVLALPLTGGAGRQLFSFDAPEGLRPEGAVLEASATRAVLKIELGEGPGRIDATQTFAGPLDGPWSELQPFTGGGRPNAVSTSREQVDGERIFVTEARGEDVRVVVRDPEPHEVAFAPGESASSATFAGDLVATIKRGDGEDGTVLVIRDWRTGTVVSSTELDDGINSIALRPDGRAVVITWQEALYEVRPGAPPRLLARVGGSKAAFAGDSIVHDPGDRLQVVDASGSVREFGVPTETFGGFSTDGSRVLWVANGCLLVDDVGAAPAAALEAGPCLREELALDVRHPPNPYLADSLTVMLRCVAAPQACRGALRLTTGWEERESAISRQVSFSIPAGHARRLRVPLTCHGYRVMRRSLARKSEAVVRLDARTGDGERFHADLWYGVASGPAEAIRRCAGIRAGRSRLPGSIDVGPLRGQALAGTPCRFERRLQYGNPGDGTIRLGLDCDPADGVGARGFVDVERVQSGHMIPEDTLRCTTERDRDPSAAPSFSCELWHRKVGLHARTWCVGTCDAAWRKRARKAARATLDGLVARLASLPARPCRLCPRYVPPERMAVPPT